jgi:hypothetical protein
MINRFTKDFRVVIVPNREASTLKEVIKKHIKRGSKIHHDGYPSYSEEKIKYRTIGMSH